MKLRHHRSDETPEIVLISLIDVVLSLVIFFMVTTTFSRLAPLEISLPESSAEPREKPEEAIEVAIDVQGRYYVGGRELVNTQLETLKRGLVDAAAGRPAPPVVLSADARTPHQAVVTALDAARQVGFTRLSFATAQRAAEGDR
ncbi:MAG: biopolymer transporter ExbD [Gammaproteobacteria bacterium]|nr:biopolymer transporter ExbD [Gammaproteobacteria bacterium]